MNKLNDFYSSFEHLTTEIFENADKGSLYLARIIADLIRKKTEVNEMIVLGLATGASPIRMYDELVRMHKEKGLSFKNVITFNLDEYYPIQSDSLQSYNHFMYEHLFSHIDIKPENVHIPDGTLDVKDVPGYCRSYEEKIREYGGLDVQILGIGRTGHIGFNEPGSHIKSVTRLVSLDNITRLDAAKDFLSLQRVPRRAITMGISTIMGARRIYILAWGDRKAHVVKKMVEGDIDNSVPATYLQEHDHVYVILDKPAAAMLSRIKTPWLTGFPEWTDVLRKNAVVWLSLKLDNPILKLTDKDYNDNGLGDLVADQGPSYDINIKVFNELQHTITGWPGGKPNADDSQRPERAEPAKKNVIVFSPHPDDDVISMGGSLMRLVDQGHNVHVAYQTSGNIGVFDEDALRFLDFVLNINRKMELKDEEAEKRYLKIQKFIESKEPSQKDSQEVLWVKGLIRETEARAACKFSGVNPDKIHFLNMPFYETGQIRKAPLGKKDITIIEELIWEIKPHQIFAAGDFADPHDTQQVCLQAIMKALKNIKASSDGDWLNDCYLWLYRGAWEEWPVEQLEMTVPLSPGELERKRKAIFIHQSQKDSPLFPGDDTREFWQRAEERNRHTASLFNKLGLANYEAMEAFVRLKF